MACTKQLKNKAEKEKGLFNLWRLSDELVVLQAAIDFKQEFNKNPATNRDAFFNFVKGKLHYTEFTKLQVMDKLRKLKNKYNNNLNKSLSLDFCFCTSYDAKCFRLSKEIWGMKTFSRKLEKKKKKKYNNKLNKSSSSSSASVSWGGHPVVLEDNMMNVKDDNPLKDDMMKVSEEKKKEEEKDFRQLYPHLIKGFEDEDFPKVDSVVLEDWNTKSKKIRLAETDAYLRKLALIQEQANWFYNKMKSSD